MRSVVTVVTWCACMSVGHERANTLNRFSNRDVVWGVDSLGAQGTAY